MNNEFIYPNHHINKKIQHNYISYDREFKLDVYTGICFQYWGVWDWEWVHGITFINLCKNVSLYFFI